MRRSTVGKRGGGCSTASCWCSAAASPAAAQRRQPGGHCGVSAQRRPRSSPTDPRWARTPSAGLRTRSRSLLTKHHGRASGAAHRMIGAVALTHRCRRAAVQQQPSNSQTWTLRSTRCLHQWLRKCLLLRRRSSSLCQRRQAARLQSSRFPPAPAAPRQPGRSCQPFTCMPHRSQPEPSTSACSPSTRLTWRSCCGGTRKRRDRCVDLYPPAA